MTTANSLSFLIFGIIMRFLPVIAPTLVAAHADSIAAAEATTRGLWLISMGYVLGGIGLWFTLKNAARHAGHALIYFRQRAEAAREARQLAHARQARTRAVATRIEVRAQY